MPDCNPIAGSNQLLCTYFMKAIPTAEPGHLAESRNRRQHHAEANSRVCVGRDMALSPTGTAVHPGGIPSPSTNRVQSAVGLPEEVRHGPSRRRGNPVPAPFEHVAMHVTYSPGVGQELSRRVGFRAAVGGVPSVAVEQ